MNKRNCTSCQKDIEVGKWKCGRTVFKIIFALVFVFLLGCHPQDKAHKCDTLTTMVVKNKVWETHENSMFLVLTDDQGKEYRYATSYQDLKYFNSLEVGQKYQIGSFVGWLKSIEKTP